MSRVEFLIPVQKLKRLQRTGWIDAGLPASIVESVADHSFQSAIFAMLLAIEEQAKIERSMALALLHDLGESLSGDIAPEAASIFASLGVEKRLIDREAERRLLLKLKGASRRFVQEALEEYHAQKTPAARCARDGNLLDRGYQAFVYESTFGIQLRQTFVEEIASLLATKAAEDLWGKIRGKFAPS